MKTEINKLVSQKNQSQRGFTLTELMLVVVIIGILAALVIPRITGESEHARKVTAYTDVNGGIKSAVDHYEVDNGKFPNNLQDLIVAPADAKNWRGPYLDKAQLPVDPWKKTYVYHFPGKHNPNGYDLLSVGPDGKEGTDDDIGNWMQ
jgi:general secretion pathway protein G